MLKSLKPYIGEYKFIAILTPILVTGEVALDIIIPLLMSRIIDVGILQHNFPYILQMGGWLLLASILSLVAGLTASNCAAKASTGFAKNLRQAIYDHIQSLSFHNLDKFPTSSLITRMTTDVDSIQTAFQMTIRIMVRAPAMLCLAAVVALCINYKLALIFIGAMPVLALGYYFILHRTRRYFPILFSSYDELNKVVEENLNCIRVVKSHVRETYEISKFQQISSKIKHYFSMVYKMLALHVPLSNCTVHVCTVLILWMGAKMIIQGEMTVGNLTGLTVYIRQALSAMRMISMIFIRMILARTSVDRVNEILSETSDLVNSPHPFREVLDGSISFERVNFSYVHDAQKLCLREINLQIKPGETIGILGNTGSGKSSLVQLISRLYDVTEGAVKVGGIDVRNYDMAVLRTQVAIVLQKNLLFSGTIRDNLLWGNSQATEAEIQQACQIAQADKFIREFPLGYDTVLEQGATNLSGGQKQRICLARSILRQPKILILDDVTSAVDTKTETLIRQALQTELPNITKIIISQRVSSLQGADRIIIMENGQISGLGTAEELWENNAVYREIVTLQTKLNGA